jgi:WD40 repeat protein
MSDTWHRRDVLRVAGGLLLAGDLLPAAETGDRGRVVGQPQAAQVGADVLAAGGNAVDAVVAAALTALAVVCTALGCESPPHTGTDEQDDPKVTLPELATIQEHFWHLAFAPDGKSLAISGRQTIVVFEVPSGKEAVSLDDKGNVLHDLCFSPDGKSIAAACGPFKVKLWDAATGKLHAGLKEDPGYVEAVLFTPDSKSLITSDNRGILKYWSLATGKEEARFSLGATVRAMSYSPDGKTLATGDNGNTLRLWDAVTRKEVRSWKDHGPISQLAWSADGKRLASGAGSGIHVWDVASGKEVAEVAKAGVGVALAFSPKGDLLAIGRKDGSVVVLDGTTYEKLAVLRHDQKPVRFLAFSPDGKVLATVATAPAQGGATKLWDASKLERDHKRKP